MKTTFYSILLIVLYTTLPQSLHAEYFKHIGLTEGLSQPSVMSIYQDTLGRMWLGTREGVNVYDGNNIVSYKAFAANHYGVEDSTRIDNEIHLIKGDRNGDVFLIAGYSLIKYDIRKEIFSTIKDKGIVALDSYNGEIWCIMNGNVYQYDNKVDSLVEFMPTAIKEISYMSVTEKQIYIGSKLGLYSIDREKKSVKHLISNVQIYRIFESSQKEIWVGCRMEGLYRINAQGKVAKIPYAPHSPYGTSSTQIRDIVEDEFHNIWFGTFDGLQKYTYETGEYSLIKPDRSMGGLDHPSIFGVYRDRQNVIWLGSYYGGVNYFNPGQNIFTRYNYDQNADKNLYFSYIGEMTEDRERNLWFCTDGGGLSCIDSRTRAYTNLKAGGGNALPHNNVKSVCYDPKRNCLYIGTYLGGLSRYDLKTKSFHNYLNDSGRGKVPGNIVFHVLFRDDCLYLSTNNGFYRMNPDTHEFTLLHTNSFCQSFDIDHKGNVWLVFWDNLVRFNLEKPTDSTQFNLREHGCYFRPTKIKATPSGLYFGSLGSGFFHYSFDTKTFSNFSVKKGQLLSDYCYNLSITKMGNVLITSDKGVTLFSPENQNFRSIELPSDFPASAIINDCGVFASSDDRIYVGDIKGITAFREDDFRMRTEERKLYFSALAVNNQPIYPGDPTRILDASLPFVKELKLKHDQNNLAIHFATSNYSDVQQSSQYECQLEGFDKQWIPVKRMGLHYTNLDPGSYTLHIRTQDNGFNAPTDGISLPIYIASPWYNSLWSWMIYLLATAGCIAYYIQNRTAKKILALSLEKEQFEKRHIEQMNHAKLLFFTNVSHEFRTPLTLIISHVDQLLQHTHIPPAIYSSILKINKNAQQMKNLVSELLDFRKFEQNHVVLKIANQDIAGFIKEIYYSFFDYAQQRNIQFIFTCEKGKVPCWFDARQLEKVFFNLLSNAFKYTPDGGTIEVSIDMDQYIRICVKDTGTGIAPAEAIHVFDRFFQASQNQKDSYMARGTGIGLALTKSIVEKHHGQIYVDSEIGRGSTFTVQLQEGKQAFESDKETLFLDQVEEKTFIPDSMPIGIELEERVEEPEEENGSGENSYTLLIVEDNEELLHILKELFAPYYKTITATNGKEGLDTAISEKPDLIVSDVIMPEMTGTEMCRQIKNDIDLCHIPVILLTALNTNEQNVEGLNSGADDYVTKPFHAKILLARCNNLIQNRLLIQRQLSDKPISEIDLSNIHPLDKNLLRRTVEIIDAHIGEPDFDIPMLCKEIGMGRTLFYSKFKALTGMTPNNFILSHKLKHAEALLIKYPNIQIAEISDRLGFGSAVYFTRCFKAKYNDTPQNYQKART